MEVNFSAPGDPVERSGLIFQLGTYEDRDFSLNEEEADEAIAHFAPVDLDIEHQPTVFDGKLGKLVGVWRDGDAIRGRVQLPAWLSEVLSDGDMKVSTAWDRTAKKLTGLSLVREPRISEAALASAFANFARRHHTPTGQRHLQHLHDLAVERGAMCKSDVTMSQFASSHEGRAIQQVHDVCAEHGARCEKPLSEQDRDRMGSSPLLYSQDKTKERKRRMNLDFKALFSGLFGALEERDDLASQGSAPAQAAPSQAPARAQDSGASQFTMQTTNSTPLPATGTNAAPFAPAVITASAPDPRIAELEKQLAERDAQIARDAEARITQDAAAFAEQQVREGRATPAEQDGLIALFAQALRDDQANGPVVFGEGDQKKEIGRAEQLRDMYAARPASILTQEVLQNGQDGQQTSALYNQQTTPRTGPDGKKTEGPLSAERRRQLLEGSSLGRVVVRDEAKNGHGGS